MTPDMIAIYWRSNKALMRVEHGRKTSQILIGTIIQLASYKLILQTFPSSMMIIIAVVVANLIIKYFRFKQKPGHQLQERIPMGIFFNKNLALMSNIWILEKRIQSSKEGTRTRSKMLVMHVMGSRGKTSLEAQGSSKHQNPFTNHQQA